MDPLKDQRRFKILKKCISHLCLLNLVLALRDVFLGVCAYLLYEDKSHYVLFGSISIMQLIGAPIGWVAIRMGNRILFLICAIVNLIWIISVIILLLYYWLIDKSPSFNQEIDLHVSALIFVSASIILAICCLVMMKRLNMISFSQK